MCTFFHFSFFFLRFYLFIHERHTDRGRDIGRGRSRLMQGAQCETRSQDSDHDLSQSQIPFSFFLRFYYLFMSDRERERERGRDTGRGRSRLMQGARRGTRCRVSSITPQAAAAAKRCTTQAAHKELILK